MYKIRNNEFPECLTSMFNTSNNKNYNVRSNELDFALPKPNTNYTSVIQVLRFGMICRSAQKIEQYQLVSSELFSITWKNELVHRVSTIYNMSGRVVSDIQTRAEGESLYIRYNTDSSYEFIGETTHLMSSLAK